MEINFTKAIEGFTSVIVDPIREDRKEWENFGACVLSIFLGLATLGCLHVGCTIWRATKGIKDNNTTEKIKRLFSKKVKMPNSEQQEDKDEKPIEVHSKKNSSDLSRKSTECPIIDQKSKLEANKQNVVVDNVSFKESLRKLDLDYAVATKLASNFTKRFLENNYKLQLPDIEINGDLYREKCDVIDAFERKLKDKYGNDFMDVNWHGRLSQQRILLQNSEFLEMLSDEDMVKVVLLRHKEGKETDLGNGNKISTMLCFALSSNNLSYLATVAPSWKHTPYDWGFIEGMGGPYETSNDPAFVPDMDYLRVFQHAMTSIQSVFSEISGSKSAEEQEEIEFQKKMINLSVLSIINAFNDIIKNKDDIDSIVVGQAFSVYPEAMANQCFGVMKNYDLLYSKEGNSDTKALGYGMVSHALDVRHLCAALYYNRQEDEFQDNQGKEAFGKLLLRVIENPDSQSAILMKSRLIQVMKIVAEKKGISKVLEVLNEQE